MARSYARFTTSIWRDPDFTSLEQDLQAVYFMLCTQPDVTAAGSLAVTTGRWARLASGVTRSQVDEQITALQTHTGRHVIVDYDTEELLIRTFVKWDGGWSNSKRLPVIFDALGSIASVHIRDIVVDELRKLADGIGHTATDKAARDALSVKLAEYLNSASPSDRVVVTLGESVPLALPPIHNQGAVPVAADAVDAPPFNPNRCKKHQTIDIPGNCGDCKDAREAEERRIAASLEADVAARKARSAAIAACTKCDEHGRQLRNGVIVSRLCDCWSPSSEVGSG